MNSFCRVFHTFPCTLTHMYTPFDWTEVFHLCGISGHLAELSYPFLCIALFYPGMHIIAFFLSLFFISFFHLFFAGCLIFGLNFFLQSYVVWLVWNFGICFINSGFCRFFVVLVLEGHKLFILNLVSFLETSLK